MDPFNSTTSDPEFPSDQIPDEIREISEEMPDENKAVSSDLTGEIPTVENFDYRTVDSFEDIYNAVGSENIAHATDVIGDGFSILEEKAQLVDVPLMILSARFTTENARGEGYWSIRVITKSGEKFVVNDGGYGIAQAMDTLKVKAAKFPVYVPHGLRRRDYTHPEYGQATTYYFDTSR